MWPAINIKTAERIKSCQTCPKFRHDPGVLSLNPSHGNDALKQIPQGRQAVQKY